MCPSPGSEPERPPANTWLQGIRHLPLLLCFCSSVLWQRNVSNIDEHLLWCHQRLSPALSSRGEYGSWWMSMLVALTLLQDHSLYPTLASATHIFRNILGVVPSLKNELSNHRSRYHTVQLSNSLVLHLPFGLARVQQQTLPSSLSTFTCLHASLLTQDRVHSTELTDTLVGNIHINTHLLCDSLCASSHFSINQQVSHRSREGNKDTAPTLSALHFIAH